MWLRCISGHSCSNLFYLKLYVASLHCGVIDQMYTELDVHRAVHDQVYMTQS